MNKNLSTASFILISAGLFFSCSTAAKKESNNTSSNPVSLPAENVKPIPIDTRQSVVTWKGSMLIGANSHTGNVYLSKGELLVEQGHLVGGTVEVNMNSIEDENRQSDNNLIQHLKDPDFFDVKKFPFSTITITKVASINEEEKEITGNLTIKGITNPVSFPAKVEITSGLIKANGRLGIDRTKWDVRYKSGKFYDLLADQTMSDSIQFNINIVAKANPLNP